MSLDLQVVAHPMYLQVILTGIVTLPATQDAIVRIIDAARENRLPCMLIDWRQVTGMHRVTTLDRFQSNSFLAIRVCQLRAMGLFPIRIANVTRQFRRDAEGFSITVAANRGLVMTATTTMSDALAWLGVNMAADGR